MTKDLEYKRHSLAHLLAAAIADLYPQALPTIGPAIDNGFYYDFDRLAINEADLPKIEQKMRELIKGWKSFEGKEVTENDAKNTFAHNPYKWELIADIAKDGQKITFYTSGDFTDLCRGGHSDNPSKDIASGSWKLDRIAGAYWRGSEKNKMLTRIYGLAFDTKEELAAYEKQIEEARKRDHKKIGPELDLFTFSELVGSGLPLWTPKGTKIRHLLDDFVWNLRSARGYERVEIPHITKKDLYEKSGHWQKFKDELFRVTTREGHEFAMKPMNCPHHTQIYARKLWSYRELPQRYANTTTCYRDEQSGELSGLSRTRAFAQDDAHVFCRMSQAKEEFLKIWDIIHEFYGTFGFALTVRLSRHDSAHMEKYLGDEVKWQEAEGVLKKIIEEKGVKYIDGPGEAAFYGPKLDFLANDSLGREWQVATIQLDFFQPENFNLVCVNEKSEKERIVMIHAAIMGSIERFLSILIEHTGGNFPLWLSPVQVKILPIGEAHLTEANRAKEILSAAGLRSEVDESGEGLGKKVRNAKVMKIPYFVIIGDKDIEAKKVTLESRDKGAVGQMTTEEVAELLSKENRERK